MHLLPGLEGVAEIATPPFFFGRIHVPKKVILAILRLQYPF